MALVTITYRAWDHNREVVPASRSPRVGFRPLGTSYSPGLMTNREVWGTLHPTTGAGEVQLESLPGVMYVPYMDWLTGEAKSENDRGGYCEWAPFFPGRGGSIDSLEPAAGVRGLLYGFGNPPESLDAAVYLDITGPTIRIFGPANAHLEG